MFYCLLFPEFKVLNKSLSHELNNVFILMVVVVVSKRERKRERKKEKLRLVS